MGLPFWSRGECPVFRPFVTKGPGSCLYLECFFPQPDAIFLRVWCLPPSFLSSSSLLRMRDLNRSESQRIFKIPGRPTQCPQIPSDMMKHTFIWKTKEEKPRGQVVHPISHREEKTQMGLDPRLPKGLLLSEACLPGCIVPGRDSLGGKWYPVCWNFPSSLENRAPQWDLTYTRLWGTREKTSLLMASIPFYCHLRPIGYFLIALKLHNTSGPGSSVSLDLQEPWISASSTNLRLLVHSYSCGFIWKVCQPRPSNSRLDKVPLACLQGLRAKNQG